MSAMQTISLADNISAALARDDCNGLLGPAKQSRTFPKCNGGVGCGMKNCVMCEELKELVVSRTSYLDVGGALRGVYGAARVATSLPTEAVSSAASMVSTVLPWVMPVKVMPVKPADVELGEFEDFDEWDLCE